MAARGIKIVVLVFGVGIASCARNAVPAGPANSLSPVNDQSVPASASKIDHVIVVVQQNRSFDNLFAGYPNADAPTFGYTSTGERVNLAPITLQDQPCGKLSARVRAANEAFRIAYSGGKMDGWNLLDRKRPHCPYTQVVHRQTDPYWDLAKGYAIADQFFASTRFELFVEQLYIVAGTTRIAPHTYDIGMPTQLPGTCDAPPGTRTSLLRGHRILFDEGPFPCFTQFPSIANLLDKAHVGWRYYVDSGIGEDFDPFATLQYVADGPDRKRDISTPATNVFSDLSGGKLRPVSWVASPLVDSDLPGYAGGPKWVASIVADAQKSRYWPHLAIVVIWDGGDTMFYDNVAPPQLDSMGLGFREPMLVVSPLAKRHYVSHTQYEFGSILKFIEQNWNLGSLGATDRRANSIDDMFSGS